MCVKRYKSNLSELSKSLGFYQEELMKMNADGVPYIQVLLKEKYNDGERQRTQIGFRNKFEP